MKQRVLIALLSACTLLPACEANTSKANNPPSSATQATTTVAAEIAAQKAILLDVRTADEYASGHAPQAKLMPYDSIAQQISSVAPDKNQTIYLYCRSGRRSGIAAETLKSMGYTHVTDLGGLGQLGQYGLSVP